MGYDSVVLASASERRSLLLTQIGVSHRCVAANIDESPRPGERPGAYVARLAESKALAVVEAPDGPPDCPVLAADTTVALDGKIFGKPADEADCVGMLMTLAGRTHEVHTTIALWYEGGLHMASSTSYVAFREIGEQECRRYWGVESRLARRAPMPSRGSVRSSSHASKAAFRA